MFSIVMTASECVLLVFMVILIAHHACFMLTLRPPRCQQQLLEVHVVFFMNTQNVCTDLARLEFCHQMTMRFSSMPS